jgi:hypothetical protein
MKKTLLVLTLLVSVSICCASGLNENMVQLAKIYRNFMFRNSPTESTFKQLNTIQDTELTGAVKFITETITTGNSLASKEFLSTPDEKTMLHLYTIRRVSWNLSEETPKENKEVIAEFQNKPLSRYELMDSYYDMLFSGIANKNQPFDLSNINFELFDYGLANDTEKGIFFLKAMNFCGTSIWGYMNIATPPNFKKALTYIDKFPKFNGQPYYQYIDFGFPDFEMEVEKDKGKESYKSHYINKYYDTLLSHLASLSQKKKQKEAKEDLALGSILRERNYYKYSKNKKVLESIFKTIER